MRPLAMALIGVLLLAGCGGDNTEPAAPTTTGVPSAPVAAAAALSVNVTELGPSGTNIYVGFEAVNDSSDEQRFEWNKLIVTGPDGTPHTVYRDPANAPYELVPAKHRYVGGGNVQYPTFAPGRYTVAYDRRPLADKTL